MTEQENIAFESMVSIGLFLHMMTVTSMMCVLKIIIKRILFTYRQVKEMKNYIETPTIGEILFEEFMEPNNITAYKLAKEINVPTSRIQDIIHNRRKITVDTSLRLARYFGVSDKYFLDMQNDIDIRNTKKKIQNEINAIHTFQYA